MAKTYLNQFVEVEAILIDDTDGYIKIDEEVYIVRVDDIYKSEVAYYITIDKYADIAKLD